MNPIRNNDFQILNSRNLASNNNININFPAENNRYQEEENNNMAFNLLNSINESLNQDLSQSVFDLVKCFICYSPVTDPLSCPKCNNFACSKCLEMYYGNQRAKKCPLCKQEVELKELKKNEVISDVEKILNKGDTSKKNKIDELESLIKEKKNKWQNHANSINSILNRIFKYQETLTEYKKEYENFLINCQDVVRKTFEKYLEKTEELVKSLLSHNKLANDSIIKYDNMAKQKKDEDNIKNLINEVISMERQRFNDKSRNQDEIYKFLNTPIKITPIINHYYVKELTITKKDINNFEKMSNKGIHHKVGNFQIVYSLNINDGYKVICEFSFTTDKKMNGCFLATQTKTLRNGEVTQYPMKLIKHENNNFVYECFMTIDEYELNAQNWIKLKTEVLAFYM